MSLDTLVLKWDVAKKITIEYSFNIETLACQLT